MENYYLVSGQVANMIRIEPEEETSPLELTTLSDEGYLEDDLREWILSDPDSILGEDFLIIGREVSVKDIGDAIDLLGIDRDGNIVVIELKRGSLRGTVDFQSLKYAAYSSHWDYNRLRDQFSKFKKTNWGKNLYDDEATFTEALDEFCNDDYTLNQDQRILLVGESIEDRLDLVVRWLSDRSIDLTVVEIQLLKDDGRLYLDAKQTIPAPEKPTTDVSPDTSEEPWKDDGRSWHLNERSNEETAGLLEQVVATLEDIENLDGPEWGQKHYLSFMQNKKRRIAIRTKRTLFHIDVMDVLVTDMTDEELAEDAGLPTDTIKIDDDVRGTGRPGVRITCRAAQGADVDAVAALVDRLLNLEEP